LGWVGDFLAAISRSLVEGEGGRLGIGGKVGDWLLERRWVIGFSGRAKRELEDGREMDDRLWGGDQGHP
jgi:hypothetical protein